MSAAIYPTTQRNGGGRASPKARRAPVVLIVEDELPVLDMLCDVLEEEGFTVLSARGGPQALRIIGQVKPDLILTDLMMPIMDGRALREQLRHDPQTASIPVMLMSAAYKRQPDDAFAAVIAKPFEIDDLLQQIHRHLAKQ